MRQNILERLQSQKFLDLASLQSHEVKDVQESRFTV